MSRRKVQFRATEQVALSGPARAHRGNQAGRGIARVHKVQPAERDSEDPPLQKERHVAVGGLPVVARAQEQAGIDDHHGQAIVSGIGESDFFRKYLAQIVRPLTDDFVLVTGLFVVGYRVASTAIVPEEETTTTLRAPCLSADSQTFRVPSMCVR